MWLIGVGMFFDGFDIYVAGTVLGATLRSGFSTMSQNAQFVSVTFVGMMLGSFATGFLGDRYGRRFTYQANLAIFGVASIASAFAPSMKALILLRFVMGVGLGAENVVGYATMTEFVPAGPREMAGRHLRVRSCRPTRHGVARNADYPEIRLAHYVRARRRGRAGRLAVAKSLAGVAALVGIDRPN